MVNISMPFMKSFGYNDYITEFDIIYEPNQDKYTDLITFVETYGDRRINIAILQDPWDDVNFEELKALTAINPNVHFKFNIEYIELIEILKKHQLSFYFDALISDWDEFNSLVRAGISDIYITGVLGFSLPSVATIANSYGVKIRAILNIAQVNDPIGSLDTLTAFYIRPEDIKIYAEYIDSFEVHYEKLTELAVLYQAYALDNKWFGSLQEIIYGLNQEVDNTRLISTFGLTRYKCNKRCYQGSNCNICYNLIKLTKVLKNKNLILTES